METSKTYENFPTGIVLVSNFVSLTIYVLGILILLRVGSVVAIGYVLYILVFEYLLLRNHCTKCFYWGKTCAFGQGRLSALFFKKGDNSKFSQRKMTWKDMVPDMLVLLLPLVAGSIVLIVKFDVLLLSALILQLLLTTCGNGFIRGKLTCSYCKQRELGCPADELFSKEKEKNDTCAIKSH